MSPDRKNTRGPKPGTGGRPKGPARVKLTTTIKPETREALGDAPGVEIDRLVENNQPRKKKKP